MTTDQVIEIVKQAIAKQEGFYDTEVQCRLAGNAYPNIPQSRNNPGNVMDVPYFQQTKKFRVRQFDSVQDGWRVLETLVRKRLIGQNLTPLEFIAGKPGVYGGYAPAGHGNNKPELYAANIARALGIASTDPIRVVLS